jgi:hypothetical protein
METSFAGGVREAQREYFLNHPSLRTIDSDGAKVVWKLRLLVEFVKQSENGTYTT